MPKNWIIYGTNSGHIFIAGTVSLFMPNGYLLYNFAATFLVDMTFIQTRRFFVWNILLVNVSYFILLFITNDRIVDLNLNFIPPESILSKHEFLSHIAHSMFGAGLLSMVFAILHWKLSISPLYENNTIETVQEEDKEDNLEEIPLE